MLAKEIERAHLKLYQHCFSSDNKCWIGKLVVQMKIMRNKREIARKSFQSVAHLLRVSPRGGK